MQVPTFEVNDLGELREPFAHLVGISEVISGQATEEWVWWWVLGGLGNIQLSNEQKGP